MVTQPKNVERTIYFYRSFVGVSDTGDFEPFDPTPAMDIIRAFVGTPDWYQDYDAVNDDVLGLLPDGLYLGHPTARLCLIRRTAIPQLELGGTITDIPKPTARSRCGRGHTLGFLSRQRDRVGV